MLSKSENAYMSNLNNEEFLRIFFLKLIVKLKVLADLIKSIKAAEDSKIVVDGKLVSRYIVDSDYVFCDEGHVCIPVWVAIDIKASIVRDSITALEMVMRGFDECSDFYKMYEVLIMMIGVGGIELNEKVIVDGVEKIKKNIL